MDIFRVFGGPVRPSQARAGPRQLCRKRRSGKFLLPLLCGLMCGQRRAPGAGRGGVGILQVGRRLASCRLGPGASPKRRHW